MRIIKKSIYTKHKEFEVIGENVSEYWGKLLVDSVNNDGSYKEWKLCLVDDNFK
ncbi:hypothetical protein M5X17_31220 [Paenibacillus alvei]|uniref:hypothetical protein n=1 Tax=Paenibacillus alvei TaxID=44250 RepID=UPI0022819EBC|nr:hypothetical protein [Paenibacillus alvei]MCY9738165.1 hypothetical protein [Paenibacillus alvei]